jgi:membrane protein DedA with SNARE-associated domain
MDVKHLLLTYGPLVVLIWTFFEGETVLVVAGILAQQGYMSLELCILAAFAGSLAGDQLYFWIGRKFGRQILDWRPSWRTPIDRALRLLVRYQNLFILSFRFIYVVRNVASFSIGLAGVSFRRFTLLNTLAAAIWALSFGFGGYFFGRTLEVFFGRVEQIEGYVLGAVAFVFIAFLIYRWIRRRRALRNGAGALPEASGNE